jgi:5-methylcytosine-specific restriction endonuclease McrA
VTIAVSPDGLPALVLNADYRPLSYYPLSLWSWQDVIKAVFLDRVNIVAEYEHQVSSPTFSMRLPSVVSLKSYVKPSRHPAFTRFNVFLRDRFQCQYCGTPEDLTFDHVTPRHRGGATTWENVVAACSPCNLRKGGMMPAQAKAGCSRPTICTKAGWTISTGMSNWSRRLPVNQAFAKAPRNATIARIRLATAFQPAKDRPSTRNAALSQDGGT